MKIHGVDGMSPENIRDEINRGGRLVIYTYCVSILVMTFKRPTDIRLIRAGHSPAAAGWPYVLVSFLFGWWGFPWGPIYTIECIYRNLCGGLDVTDDVLRSILPATALKPAAAPAPAAPAQSTFGNVPAPKRGFDLKIAGLMLGAVCALVGLGLTIYCLQKQQDLTVVLTSGLAQPYTVQLNGQSYTLKPHSAEVLHLPEGGFTLQDAPGGHIVGSPRTFSFRIPLFSHLDTERVAIINPDRAAVLLTTEIPYFKDGTTPPADEAPVYTLLANQPSYFIPKPDFVIEAADPRVSMPTGTTRVVKTRLEQLRDPDLSWVLENLTAKVGYPAAHEHLMILAAHRSNEDFLRNAVRTLKPEDMPAFFKVRLAERPVLIEWHRYYQGMMESTQPGHDLVGEYRAYLAADPGNGALMYLLGRQILEYAEQRRLFEQALTTTPPCFYAHGAMGFDAMCEGRFTDALAHYTAAEQTGLATASRKQYRRQTLWALDRSRDLLAELAAERKADPLDAELADEEIRATLALNGDRAGAQKLKETYLTAYKATKPSAENLADVETYLQAGIDYQLGELTAYAQSLSRLDSPYYKFRAACARGDLKAATEVVSAQSRARVQDWLLLYLLAQHNHDAPAAEHHFTHALEAMKAESQEYRQVAVLLAAAHPDARTICGLHIDVNDKRVLLTALGLRQPADQATYFEMARKLNFSPEFPAHLLRPVLAQTRR